MLISLEVLLACTLLSMYMSWRFSRPLYWIILIWSCCEIVHAGFQLLNNQLPLGSFRTFSFFGCFLSLSLINIFYAFKNRCEHFLEKRLLYLYAILHVIIVIYTGCRTALLAALVVLFVINFKRISQLKKTLKIIVIGGSFLLGLGIICLNLKSLLGRMFIWRVAGNMIIDKPIFGFGENGFAKNYMFYQADYFQNHNNPLFSSLSDNIALSYNDILEFVVNFGLLSFVIIFIGFVYGVKKYYLIRDRLCEMLLLGIFLQGLFYNQLKSIQFIVIIGLITGSALANNIPRLKWNIIGIGVAEFIVAGVLCTQFYERYGLYTQKNELLALKEYADFDSIKILYEEDVISSGELDRYAQQVFLSENSNLQKSEILNYVLYQFPTSDICSDLGDVYVAKNDFCQAEKFYILAHNMVPRRLKPLYKLFKMCENNGNSSGMRFYGEKILASDSHIVNTYSVKIQREVKQIMKSL